MIPANHELLEKSPIHFFFLSDAPAARGLGYDRPTHRHTLRLSLERSFKAKLTDCERAERSREVKAVVAGTSLTEDTLAEFQCVRMGKCFVLIYVKMGETRATEVSDFSKKIRSDLASGHLEEICMKGGPYDY